MEYSSKESIAKYFSDEIEKISSLKIAELQKDIAAAKKQELAKIELEVQHQVALSLGVELQDIQQKFRSDVNAVIAENAQKLHERRKQIAEDVFAEVTKKLQEMVKSDRYLLYLQAKVMAAKTAFLGDSLTFFIAPNDEVAKNVISNAIGPKADIHNDVTIKLGGFRVTCTKSMQEIDETIDRKLETKKEWFYANSKLFIKK